MGRVGYMGCLVVLGLVMLSVSCLAVFGAAGAITAERGSRVEPLAAPRTGPAEAGAPSRPPGAGEPRPPATAPAGAAGRVEPSKPAATRPAGGAEGAAKPDQSAAEAPRPAANAPVATRTGGDGNIAQRLDREAVGGGLKVRALGAAKTTQGDRSVLAIYVRIENDGAQMVRVEPASFKLVDRTGERYAVTRAVEQMFPPVELQPRPAPGQQGQLTEGNLTFEIPRTAQGLALTYDLPAGQPLRIPLPPEFG